MWSSWARIRIRISILIRTYINFYVFLKVLNIFFSVFGIHCYYTIFKRKCYAHESHIALCWNSAFLYRGHIQTGVRIILLNVNMEEMQYQAEPTGFFLWKYIVNNIVISCIYNEQVKIHKNKYAYKRILQHFCIVFIYFCNVFVWVVYDVQ